MLGISLANHYRARRDVEDIFNIISLPLTKKEEGAYIFYYKCGRVTAVFSEVCLKYIVYYR